MRVLNVRNVQEALPFALRLLENEGVQRDSRNGPVLLGPSVTTVYQRPMERVIFHPARDANPFFHLYESLWMLAGRNDVAGVVKYASNMGNYSDDGEVFHGAYGNRWIFHFDEWDPIHRGYDSMNQLYKIATVLKKNPDDRRCVLQMWDPVVDLGRNGKDVPCNLEATFQRGHEGELNLVVFCRSNDIVWGAYGANAVHFSFLLEYMALWIGCPVGTYTQISVNWHGYVSTLKQVETVRPDRVGFVENPYVSRQVKVTPMGPTIEAVNAEIRRILAAADSGLMTSSEETRPTRSVNSWAYQVHLVLEAHEAYRNKRDNLRHFIHAGRILAQADQECDWVRAAQEWLVRRLMRSCQKNLIHGVMVAAFNGNGAY